MLQSNNTSSSLHRMNCFYIRHISENVFKSKEPLCRRNLTSDSMRAILPHSRPLYSHPWYIVRNFLASKNRSKWNLQMCSGFYLPTILQRNKIKLLKCDQRVLGCPRIKVSTFRGEASLKWNSCIGWRGWRGKTMCGYVEGWLREGNGKTWCRREADRGFWWRIRLKHIDLLIKYDHMSINFKWKKVKH